MQVQPTTAPVQPAGKVTHATRLNTTTVAAHFTHTELSISLDEYSINTGRWEGFTLRSLYKSPTATSLWPWGGFGFVHLKPVNANVRERQHLLQSGFLYCSRLTILDRTSGQLIDSHLPVDADDEGIFNYDWSQMMRYLALQQFDLQNSVVTLLYGTSIKIGHDRHSGLIVKDILQRSGVALTQELRAPSSKHVFSLDTESGLQTRVVV